MVAVREAAAARVAPDAIVAAAVETVRFLAVRLERRPLVVEAAAAARIEPSLAPAVPGSAAAAEVAGWAASAMAGTAPAARARRLRAGGTSAVAKELTVSRARRPLVTPALQDVLPGGGSPHPEVVPPPARHGV